MSAAGDGSTEPNLNFLPIGKKMQTNLHSPPKNNRNCDTSCGYFLFVI